MKSKLFVSIILLISFVGLTGCDTIDNVMNYFSGDKALRREVSVLTDYYIFRNEAEAKLMASADVNNRSTGKDAALKAEFAQKNKSELVNQMVAQKIKTIGGVKTFIDKTYVASAAMARTKK
jgi:hypothetical protein